MIMVDLGQYDVFLSRIESMRAQISDEIRLNMLSSKSLRHLTGLYVLAKYRFYLTQE